jgi:hypothetical protein
VLVQAADFYEHRSLPGMALGELRAAHLLLLNDSAGAAGSSTAGWQGVGKGIRDKG